MTRHDQSLREIAAALDVDPDHLQYFRECHPDPTTDVVLNLADRPPVDGEIRSLIDEWLGTDDQDVPDDQGAPGGESHRLVFHKRGDQR